MDKYNGILSFNKELHLSSHDVINRLRDITGQKKIGHTGTLDPLAAGMLLICFGRATKLTQFLSDWDKSYRAEITLGKTSQTFDGGGEIEEAGAVPELTENDLDELRQTFSGRIEQKVPIYSAVKVDGKELYKYARKGIEKETPSRQVEIKSFQVLSFDSPRLTISIDCSKGTYIRTLAHDIGQRIGCGGYLSALIRQRVGPYSLNEAISLDEVKQACEADELDKLLISIETALRFPVINLRSKAAILLQHGIPPKASDIIDWQGDFRKGDLISMADEGGGILAIGKSQCDAALLESRNNHDFFSYVRVLT